MRYRRLFGPALAACVVVAAGSASVRAVPGVEQLTPEQFQFFEKAIRPVLMDRCYKCHSTQGEKIRGGLLLETRAGVMKGGELGPVIVQGDPDASLLIKAIRYTDDKLKMPPKGPQLTPAQVADFEKWVAMGAPDPRVGAPGSTTDHGAGPVFTAA